jgi:hypothetical protein
MPKPDSTYFPKLSAVHDAAANGLARVLLPELVADVLDYLFANIDCFVDVVYQMTFVIETRLGTWRFDIARKASDLVGTSPAVAISTYSPTVIPTGVSYALPDSTEWVTIEQLWQFEVGEPLHLMPCISVYGGSIYSIEVLNKVRHHIWRSVAGTADVKRQRKN